jgi:serine/threonine-protein kinase
VSFWKRLGWGRADAREERAAAEVARAFAAVPRRDEDADVQSLLTLGQPDGPAADAVLDVLKRSRGTSREASVLGAVVRACSKGNVDERVRVACAELLAARGEEDQAVQVLSGATSVEGLMLRADLLAARGRLVSAVALIEGVLAQDLHAPGAKERHARWRGLLGLAAPRREPVDEVATITVVQPGPFQLLREVARGGSATVYEARDPLLGRSVALKVYHRRGADHDAVAREARIAAALAGPGVVRVFDASPDEGWLAFEWLAAGSLRDRLRHDDASAPLPFGRWARELALALARVHHSALVHGDVKPANVLLRGSDEVVLSDFSIVRRVGEPSQGGSLGYVSPERLGGAPSDPSDDVYAFGRVLEDVLSKLDDTSRTGALSPAYAQELERLRAVALTCAQPRGVRPARGSALLLALP